MGEGLWYQLYKAQIAASGGAAETGAGLGFRGCVEFCGALEAASPPSDFVLPMREQLSNQSRSGHCSSKQMQHEATSFTVGATFTSM